MRYKVFMCVKEKCPNAYTIDGKILCKPNKDGDTITINTPDDLFNIGYDHVDYKEFGIDIEQ
jgi:hypothetical protein